jgi:hypothetical protein
MRFVLVIIVIIGIILAIVFLKPKETSGKYDDFAKCLSEQGIKIYGAYWCSHCKNQKSAFGTSWKYVNYIECSLPNGGQTLPCTEAGIESYPTWEFQDGSRLSGELSFDELSEKSGCELGI